MGLLSKTATGWSSFVISVALVCWLSAFPMLATAQGGQGQNAVYPASGTCCVGSPGFIDASMFVSAQNPNICAVLNSILKSNSFPPSGTVIDARGLNSNNTNMTCTTTNPSPWAGIANPAPSTLLLPAGTIVIPGPWVSPSNTSLIGEGTFATTLQACSQTPNKCSFTGTDMIDLGSAGLCNPPSQGICNNISVEHLTLDAQGQSLNGIVNANASTGSYVDDVRLYQILGTGLWIERGLATNSGTYSAVGLDLT